MSGSYEPGNESVQLCRPRRRNVSIPVDVITSDLPDDAVRAFLHVCAMEDVDSIDWTAEHIAERMSMPIERVESLMAMLAADAPEEAPPPTVPREPSRYLGHRWFAKRDQWRSDPAPTAGQPVVYFLFDAQDRCAYVGATDGFRARMKGHHDKPWVRYEAWLCNSRDAADDLELIEIRDRKPYLNRAPGSLAAMKRAGLL